MKLIPNISIYSLGAFLLMLTACGSNAENGVHSTKRERNSIKEGNTHFTQQRYADAEISYKKALEENPDNATAQFNLASSYIKQRGNDVANKADSLTLYSPVFPDSRTSSLRRRPITTEGIWHIKLKIMPPLSSTIKMPFGATLAMTWRVRTCGLPN